MFSKILKTTAIATTVGLASFNTQAASIWLTPQTQDINPFGLAPVELWADASDVGGFLAGGLDIFYDETIVAYDLDFAFDPAFPTDPDLSRTGDACFVDITIAGCSVPGEINGIAFGSFTGLAADGPTLVGTLTFRGTDIPQLGTSLLTMADNDTPAGSWFATDGSGPLIVDYLGPAGVEAEINVVPIPAAAWLMVGGLGMLVGFARRRRA